MTEGALSTAKPSQLACGNFTRQARPARTSRANRYTQVTQWRHELHAHPELAFEEHWTGKFISAKLLAFGLRPRTGRAKTGVVASLRCGTSERSIGLRADMDALALDESNALSYRSKVKGRMHACGHDGHVAMLLGAARYLAKWRGFDGTVHFIFQPAEENEAGARRMVEEGLFEEFPCSAVFALHNMPGLGLGKFGTREGTALACADFFDITVRGRAGHAASPQKALDPIPIAAELVTALNAIVSRHVSPLDAAVLTVTSIHGGTAPNVIGSSVQIQGTVRALNGAVRADIEQRVRRLAAAFGEAHATAIDICYESRYIPTNNSREPTRFALDVARAIAAKGDVIDDIAPSMGAEDFGWMADAVPGNLIWLGAGESWPELHTPVYDFNDALLPLGVRYWVHLVRATLAKR